jgi:hypothetical protein
MFSGSLSQMNLAEVLRLLSASNQTGVLLLSHNGQLVGSIFLGTGQLTHAEAGALQGLDALNHLCHDIQADFTFEVGVTSVPATLSAYPTAKLLENLKKRVGELTAFLAAMPKGEDYPRYVPGQGATGLQATAEELSLLLHANGQRTVRDIATATRIPLEQVRQTLAKFRMAGMIDLAAPVAPPPPIEPAPAPAPTAEPAPPTAAENKPARYWRGKRIE